MDANNTPMATSFGAASAAYQRGRPEYPSAVVEWLLQGVPPGTVADVGAGTGKLTAPIVAAGRTAVAIDPDAAMLEVLRRQLPDVETFVGSAEAIPLDDHSMAAVVLGQAWHWVDVERASTEVARVLRPDGALGLTWNIRDERTPWMAELGRIVHLSAAERLIASETFGPTAPFGDAERFEVEWTRPMTRADLDDMVHSRSYYLCADEAERQRIDAELGELFAGLAELDDGATIEAPYITYAFKYRVDA